MHRKPHAGALGHRLAPTGLARRNFKNIAQPRRVDRIFLDVVVVVEVVT